MQKSSIFFFRVAATNKTQRLLGQTKKENELIDTKWDLMKNLVSKFNKFLHFFVLGITNPLKKCCCNSSKTTH